MESKGLEQNRKRTFAFFCAGIAVAILLAFTLVDLVEKDLDEALINLGMGIVLISGIVCLKMLAIDQFIYRVAITLLGFFFLFNIHIGSGQGTAIFWLYCFPPVFMFFLGRKEGLVAMVLFLGLVCLLLLNPFSFDTYAYDTRVVSRFLPSFLLVCLIAYGLEASREKYQRMMNEKQVALLAEKKRLETAMEEIKTLSGLIPICSNCKKIRDDKGYWQQVETFIEHHTKAGFSHSICPDCFKIFYPHYEYPDGDGPQE